MKTVIFDDPELLALYPEGIQVHADSAAECMQAIQQYPGLRPQDRGLMEVYLPGFQSRDAIYAPTDEAVIEVRSVVSGAGGKNGSFVQIVIGIILIVASIYFPPLAAYSAQIFAVGVSLTLGGVVGLLMPQPDAEDASVSGNERSNYLPANQNTVKAGTRIPLLYGRCKAYGHILSFNITAGNYGDPAEVTPAQTPGGYEAMADINFNVEEYNWSV